MLGFENYPVTRQPFPDPPPVSGSPSSRHMIRHIIRLTWWSVSGKRLHLHLDHDPTFDEEPRGGLAARMVRLLEQAVESPDMPLHRLEFLGEGNATPCWKSSTPRAGRFRRRPCRRCSSREVARTPEAVAVVFGDERWRTASLMRGPTGWRTI